MKLTHPTGSLNSKTARAVAERLEKGEIVKIYYVYQGSGKVGFSNFEAKHILQIMDQQNHGYMFTNYWHAYAFGQQHKNGRLFLGRLNIK